MPQAEFWHKNIADEQWKNFIGISAVSIATLRPQFWKTETANLCIKWWKLKQLIGALDEQNAEH